MQYHEKVQKQSERIASRLSRFVTTGKGKLRPTSMRYGYTEKGVEDTLVRCIRSELEDDIHKLIIKYEVKIKEVLEELNDGKCAEFIALYEENSALYQDEETKSAIEALKRRK